MYRSASTELLVSQSSGADGSLLGYLEDLVARAYTVIHAPRPIQWSKGLRYFTTDWPLATRAEVRYLMLAAACVFGGFLLAFALCITEPAAFEHVMPGSVVNSYGERPEDYRAERFGELDDDQAAMFSSHLLTNNIKVTISAFCYGLSLGVGTVAVLFFNGAMLGAIAANFQDWGMSLGFWALILPHGVLELFAIVLGGGGGLILADALLRPGRMRRTDSLRKQAPKALKLAAMSIPLLSLAALIEAFVTPSSGLSEPFKLGIAATTAFALALYLRAPWLNGSPSPGKPGRSKTTTIAT